MRSLFTGILIFLLAGASVSLLQAESETYPVRIIFEPRPDAKFYQIEWLENDDVHPTDKADPQKSRIEKITNVEIDRELETRFRYFRLRSAYRDGLYGPWGEVVTITRSAKRPEKQNPTEENASTGPQTNDGTKNADSTPAEKNIHTEKAETSIPIEKAENTENQEPPAQQTQATGGIGAPRTYVKFYAPFIHGKGGFTVGGKTKIALRSQVTSPTVEKINYRIYKEGADAGAWQQYENEIEVSSFSQNEYRYYTIEYQATSKSGIVETAQTRRMLIDTTGPEIIEVSNENKAELQFSFKDENYPIVVRVYHNGKLIADKYFKFWNAHDIVKVPSEQGLEIKAIDLLGNEAILKR
ncbi:MAG TPA: hypothetical protein PLY93_07055 [Turneriella sp.]|nr:hypothetical protein [Turneriella sp.]